jgi:PmbA protein
MSAKRELHDVVGQAVEAAIGFGAGDAEAFATEASKREVRVHDGAVESLSTATERGVGVRSWIGGRVGFAFGTDLSEAGVASVAERSAQAAAVADEDRFALPPEVSGDYPTVEGLADSSVAQTSTDRVVELALEVERAALAEDSRVVGVEQAVYFDSGDRVAIRSSRGVDGEFEASGAYAYLQALADGDSGRETGLGFGIARGPRGLDPGRIGTEAARRATEMIGAEKPESRACPVVLDPTVAASFVGLLGRALGADAVQRGRSPLEGRLGEEVAGKAFVLRDDALDPSGLDSSPFDGEGVPRRRNELIAEGALRSYLFDTYTANRGETSSTGNAGRSGYRTLPGVSASNLVVVPGDLDLAGLLDSARDGVLVTDVAGLHSGVNPVTGVFSVGASGRAIRGGELAQPLREFTIASDLISMLRAVRAAGSQPRWVPFGGSVSAPPLLIGEMTVAGS